MEEGALRRVSGGGYGLALVWVVAGEGALRWGRAYGCRWAKVRRRGAGVRCGGRVRIGVGGRKFVGVGAGVRRCVEEGALRRTRADGCGRAQVRTYVGEGALRRGVRMCMEGRKFVARGRRCAAEGAGVWVWKGESTLKRGRRCAAVGVYVGEWVGTSTH